MCIKYRRNAHRLKRKIFLFLGVVFFGGFFLLTLCKPPELILKNIGSQAIYEQSGKLLRLTLSSDEKYRLWVPFSKLPPKLIDATLLQEDKYFYYHPGVNPVSLLRAFFKTYFVRDRRIGASTLTMQLVRLRFSLNTKSFFGKIKQIGVALWVERHYSKQEILEAYLNYAPYGGNIEGVGAASLYYFGKAPHLLSIQEVIALSVIPQNPTERRLKKIALNDESHAFYKAYQGALKRWCEATKDSACLSSNASSVAINLKKLPFEAPHFTNYILKNHKNTSQIRTSLNFDLQKKMERVVQNHLLKHQFLGLNNAAILLVDRETMKVRVWIGSANFWDKSIEGQVDGVLGMRSPGSTLKPFIYALAIEQGLIHPGSLLKDAPYSKASYHPENIDKTFLGPLPALDALNFSRNVPAVMLANKIKNPDLFDFLKEAGQFFPKEKSFYGLALALGATEISLYDLIKLYAILGNLGILKKIEVLESSSLVPYRFTASYPKRLLSESASFLTLEILKDHVHPRWINPENNLLPIYWKTGTSFGFKDAWTVGMAGSYLLGVWLGDFSGKENPALSGNNAAAPLFFSLIESLVSQNVLKNGLIKPPDQVKEVEICAVSGQLPGKFCPQLKKTWFIPGKSPIEMCKLHRLVHIDPVSRKRVCAAWKGQSIAKVFEFWPSDLLHLFEQARIQKEMPPPFHADCIASTLGEKGMAPEIVSPQKNTLYHIRLSDLETQKIPFKAITEGDVGAVYWFLNKTYLGKSHPNTLFFWEGRAGTFDLTAVDDRGRASHMPLRVRMVP